jgi:hypothetical protein
MFSNYIMLFMSLEVIQQKRESAHVNSALKIIGNIVYATSSAGHTARNEYARSQVEI